MKKNKRQWEKKLTNTVLVLMARSLTIFSECLQGLVDKGDIVFIDIETKESQTSSGGATYAIQKHESFAD